MDTKPEEYKYKPNLKGMMPQEMVDAAVRRLSEVKKAELSTWQKLNPKNWPTKLKIAAAAAVGAALTASGVGSEIVAPILSLLFGS